MTAWVLLAVALGVAWLLDYWRRNPQHEGKARRLEGVLGAGESVASTLLVVVVVGATVAVVVGVGWALVALALD